MADIINLNRVRKSKAKEQAQQLARDNRVLHGLTKAEKTKVKQEAERDAAKHDGKELD